MLGGIGQELAVALQLTLVLHGQQAMSLCLCSSTSEKQASEVLLHRQSDMAC